MKRHTLAACAFSRFPALFCAVVLAVALAGCVTPQADPLSRQFSAAEITANPRILDGMRLRDTDISGMRLENVTLKDTTFLNTTGTGVVMKNVVLNNCRFINAQFDDARLENVTMNGGLLTCEGDPYNLEKRTRFSNSLFINVTLDDVSIENAEFEGKKGSITVRNAQSIIATHPLILGEAMNLTFDKCFFKHMTIAEVTGASTLTATNCTFLYAFWGESTFVRTRFANNVSLGGPQYGAASGSKRPAARSRSVRR